MNRTPCSKQPRLAGALPPALAPVTVTRHLTGLLLLVMLSALLLAFSEAAWAEPAGGAPANPLALQAGLRPVASVQRITAPPIDRAAVAREDQLRDQEGLPPRYALPHEVFITPATDGTWESVSPETEVWRLRITSAGALSLNLGFTSFQLPPGAALFLYAADDPANGTRGYTAADNEEHGQLWTPVVVSDDVIIELSVPNRVKATVRLALTAINVGYRFFGESKQPDKSGACNIDVICPQGDDWREEIQSVAAISTGGSIFCSGFMINNTAEDETPYFMTANHCNISEFNAASLVVYWNFFSPQCGEQSGGSLAENQTGAVFRASYSPSDMTLLELDDLPDPDWSITYAGWNRTSVNPTMAVAIHHPSGDEKSISFENDPTSTTSYLQDTGPGDGTHIRVADWDEGTTEAGSSGSPLFDQDHHVVGQLHGGWAACDNDLPDWYGRFSVSWTGGGTANTRLSDWLDPLGTSTGVLGLFNPAERGLRVSPAGSGYAEGGRGGPFLPASFSYDLSNTSAEDITYSVTVDQPWLTVSDPTGLLPAGGSSFVNIALNASANQLGLGQYEAMVTFENTTTHLGDTTRRIFLQVGIPELVYSVDLEQDPGWTTTGTWAFGQPLGQGGTDEEDGHGFPDPDSGFTGTNVYGYNLAGNYTNDLPERHLTSTAFDCSNLTQVQLKFWRWLGVESPQYDHANVRVSNDGVHYTTVWENGSETTDSAWNQQSLDISSIADGHSSVTIRWTMGPTDNSWIYCGWNIDDIEIWGIPRNTQPVFLAQFTAQPEADGVAIHWATTSRGNQDAFRLTGRLGQDEWEVDYTMQADDSFYAKDNSELLAGGGVVTYTLFYYVDSLDWIVLGTTTADLDTPPLQTRLIGARPNPFNPTTTIHFDLARAGHVRLSIFDLRGRLVLVLRDENLDAGRHAAVWDGRDRNGRTVGSGTYLYRLATDDVVQDRKMMLAR